MIQGIVNDRHEAIVRLRVNVDVGRQRLQDERAT